MKLFDVKKEEQALINSGQEKKIQEFFEPKSKTEDEGFGSMKKKKDFSNWKV